jgi:hypothetical protein
MYNPQQAQTSSPCNRLCQCCKFVYRVLATIPNIARKHPALVSTFWFPLTWYDELIQTTHNHTDNNTYNPEVPESVQRYYASFCMALLVVSVLCDCLEKRKLRGNDD